ncbi:MAG: carboxypeptidase regulatory-like domain-containing protein [Candidatus Electryonea clarkiae]|nr:carboxypeptidase regulatory-like domain-containing protein [Candidatus Electryonea clarkiae]
MKKMTLIIAVCMLFVASASISRDMNSVKAENHRILQEARTAYANGHELSPQQESLLINRGIIQLNPTELDEQGGPDEYGHYYIDSQEENGPTYEWIDISETGTDITNMGDDDYQGPFDLPFDFDFYGNEYDEIYICSNGYITFGEGYDDWGVEDCPDVSEPNNALFFCGTDMDPETGGTIYYESHDDGYWICQFEEVNDYDEEGTLTAEVLIYPNGLIYYQYQEVDDVFYLIEDEVIGIENADGTDGLRVSFRDDPENYPFDELGILFTPGEPDASLRGRVTDANTGDAIAAANIRYFNFSTETGEDGVYGYPDFFSGTYVVTIEALGYEVYRDEEVDVDVGGNTIEFELIPLAATILGTVSDEFTEEAIAGAIVSVYDEEGEIAAQDTTDDLGQYITEMETGGQFDVEVSVDGYRPGYAEDIEIVQGDEFVQDFALTPVLEANIEDLQALETGHWVTTVGFVTQPTNSTNTEATDFYIQDTTGYGIQVWADDPWVDDDLNRGDEIRVTGILDEADGITRIIDLEYEILGTGNPMHAPYIAETGDMAENGAMEGSWVQVRGQIEADTPGQGSFKINLDDGSGQVGVIIFEATGIDTSEFTADTWVVLQGILSLERDVVKIIPNMQEDLELILFAVPENLAAEVTELEEPLQLEVVLTWTHDDENDDLLNFNIYRDDVLVGDSQELTWTETLDDPNPGEAGNYTYSYTVTAVYDETETDPSEAEEVIWDITSVNEILSSGVPEKWALEAVYPNPFNPTLHIVLGVPQISEVTVEIMDILGRRVAVLHKGELSAAYHRLGWNATSNPTGLYFLRINSKSGFNEVRKVMFIK